MLAIKQFTQDVISLLFPELCNACGLHLFTGEKEICTRCLYDLPYTDFHLHDENPVAKQFWGRLNCNAVMAMLYFKKGTKVQNLLHSLKYKSKTEVGVKLGQLLAEKIKLNVLYQNVDVIIPVPLHHKKQKIRGYNQSNYIANGIAENLNIEVNTECLLKTKPTETQTKKSRYTRYENMQYVFRIDNAEQLKDKHILLVDDVITTGSTLEACGNVLLNSGIKKLSIAAIAYAK